MAAASAGAPSAPAASVACGMPDGAGVYCVFVNVMGYVYGVVSLIVDCGPVWLALLLPLAGVELLPDAWGWLLLPVGDGLCELELELLLPPPAEELCWLLLLLLPPLLVGVGDGWLLLLLPPADELCWLLFPPLLSCARTETAPRASARAAKERRMAWGVGWGRLKEGERGGPRPRTPGG